MADPELVLRIQRKEMRDQNAAARAQRADLRYAPPATGPAGAEYFASVGAKVRSPTARRLIFMAADM